MTRRPAQAFLLPKWRQLFLFDDAPKIPVRPRKPRRVMMHVHDAGMEEGNSSLVKFHCKRCGEFSEWMVVPIAAEKRGIPCSTCNEGKSHAICPRDTPRT